MIRRALALILLAAAAWADCPLEPSERVRFVPSLASTTVDGSSWSVTLTGWVARPEKDGAVRRQWESFLAASLGWAAQEPLSEETRARMEPFILEPVRGKSLRVSVGTTTFALPASDRSGYLATTLTIPAALVRGLAQRIGQASWLPVGIEGCPAGQAGDGRVLLVPYDGISVISDVDDTIKQTGVGDKRAIVANNFVREPQAVPGMAALFDQWARDGALFHYVSESPQQLLAFLDRFLNKEGFPAGSLHLKRFRFKSRTFLALFQDPFRYKTPVIEDLLTRYPHRRFILVGDAGQQDPEIYGAIARAHPTQIRLIAIRQMDPDPSPANRYETAFRDLDPSLWVLFKDPASLQHRL